MMTRLSSVALALVALAMAGGCGFPKSGPIPGAVSPTTVEMAKAKFPNATEKTLTHGRELFISKCSKCHGHPDVNYKTEAEWPEIIKRMGERADLDTEQQQAVLEFVISNRATSAPVAPPKGAPTSEPAK